MSSSFLSQPDGKESSACATSKRRVRVRTYARPLFIWAPRPGDRASPNAPRVPCTSENQCLHGPALLPPRRARPAVPLGGVGSRGGGRWHAAWTVSDRDER